MKYATVIVESRELPDLCDVIQNHLDHVPSDWDFVMFGSAQNKQIILDRFPQCKFLEVDYFQFLLGWGSLPHINSKQYNYLLAHAGFWYMLKEYSRVLIFQHDSMLLREGVLRFKDFDYVGAPWYHIPICGGNGGLSLRNPEKCFRLCEYLEYDFTTHGNEDLYFSKHLDLVGGVVACQDIAKTFSVETIFYPTPIGCHAPEKYLKSHELKQLYV